MATISTRDQQFHERRHELLVTHSRSARLRDLTLLVLSSAILAISVSLITWSLDFADVLAVPVLMVAWGLFALAIIFALLSFQIGQVGTYFQMRSAREFYLRDREDGGRGSRRLALLNDLLGFVGSLVFVAATICLIVFVSINAARSPNGADRIAEQVPDQSPTVQATGLLPVE